jgi:hypothetical protein
MNQPEPAIADFERALAMNPRDTIARDGLAVARRQLTQQATAD